MAAVIASSLSLFPTPNLTTMPQEIDLASYILERLAQLGTKSVQGVPGQ